MGDLEQTGQDGEGKEQVQSWVPLTEQQHGDGTSSLAFPWGLRKAPPPPLAKPIHPSGGAGLQAEQVDEAEDKGKDRLSRKDHAVPSVHVQVIFICSI